MTENPTTNVTDRDVYITRAFAAPREIVWKFWTEPENLSQWFGPTGYSSPVDAISTDVRAGGHWNLSMVDDATGDRFPIRGRITAVTEFEYLEIVMDAETGDSRLEDVILRVTFHDHGDRTRVTVHQGPFTDEQREQTAGGWEMSFIKMDAIFAGGVV